MLENYWEDVSYLGTPRSSLVERNEGCIGPTGELMCLWQVHKNMQHTHVNILYIFTTYLADTIARFPLLKSSIPYLIPESGAK